MKTDTQKGRPCESAAERDVATSQGMLTATQAGADGEHIFP